MGLGDKCKHTGVVRQETLYKGSKSEHVATVLDTGAGKLLKMHLKGGNPFHEPALDAFIGKRVTIDGFQGSGIADILIDKVADITVLGPPGRPSRPPAPRF